MTDDIKANAPIKNVILSAFIGALLSSGVVTFVADQLAKRRTEQVIQEVRAEFERRQRVDEWKKQSLSVLLGPIVMQLDRTRRAFTRYQANNRFLESEILYKANMTIRDLLLANGHLIPDELREVSGRLIEHYDRWLEEYDRVRGTKARAPNEAFVFVGPKGYPFPEDADRLFKDSYRRMWSDLYGMSAR